MRASTRAITADELLRMPDDGVGYELVKGRLIPVMHAGGEHGIIELRLCMALGDYVERNALGLVFPGDTGFKLASNPDTVRFPDVAFVRRARVPPSGVPTGFWPGAPDLAVEIRSPDDSGSELEAKIAEYFRHGTTEVWVVNPSKKTVTIRRRDGAPQTLGENDEIVGGELLPGFRYPIARLFAQP